MTARTESIRRSLNRMLLIASGAGLVLISAGFLAYEFFSFRQSSLEQLQTLSRAIGSNCAAALAFENPEDAASVLSALKADPQIVAATLYDVHGRAFAAYPQGQPAAQFRARGAHAGFEFGRLGLTAYQPVTDGAKPLGMLFVRSDLTSMYGRLGIYTVLMAVGISVSLALAYFMSSILQRRLLRSIERLAETARAVSERQDYTVRAEPTAVEELAPFTQTFNQMLAQIQGSEGKLREQLGRLSLLQSITRATAERQDLASMFQVVLVSLEKDLPIDFGCFLQYEAGARELTVSGLGSAGQALVARLGLSERGVVPVDADGLSQCIAGHLVYEPDVTAVPFPFPQRLAQAGLRSLVIAPLIVEKQVFGALVATRLQAEAFSSGECEFLRQLSEHVALASHQSRLYGALQQAYDDLRQTQQTVLQQERLRALGQMASGIAHDINNAISPVSLYTESLLEREPNLSERARGYLGTIQRAIEDVARTVSRMREFYREREAQLTLERVELNRAIRQAAELTRPRWSDLPQQRGLMIDLKLDLTETLPEIMGAENEIRDALTNLIFNAVDAMPGGGTLSLRTFKVGVAETGERSVLEVRDTGIGMDEETRRRCLEPFYTTKGERGTGLGLAMVYGMAARHSAELEIESMVGRGTAVRVSFPAMSGSLVSNVSAPDAPRGPARCLRILLVDDDPLLIQSLRDTLQEEGHEITVTPGGQAGIEAFTAAHAGLEPFDVVVTDLGMPYIDGRKVAAAVKALAPATPVILLTGWGQRMIASQERPAHVDRVLSKPPRLSELRASLSELVA